MAIEKTKNGKYKVTVYMGVGASRFVATFDKKIDAIASESEARIRKEKGEAKAKSKDYTFEEVYKEWWDDHYLIYDGLENITLSRTKDLFRLHILPHLGKVKVKKITLKQLEKLQILWAFGDQKKNIKPYTNFKQCISYTNMVMKYALKHSYIHKNPLDLLDMPTNRKLEQEQAERREEQYYDVNLVQTIQTLIKADCCLQTYTLFTLLYSIGAGKGEVKPLIWKDIDFEKNEISLTHKLVKNEATKKFERVPGGKNKFRPRVIPITDSIVSLLKEWKKIQAVVLKQLNIEQTPEQFLFTYVNRYGEVNLPLHPDWLNDRLNKITEKYNLPSMNPHGLRHTFVSDLKNGGVPDWNIKPLVGHAPDSKETDTTYGHINKRGQKRNVEAIHSLENIRNESLE